MAGPLSPGLGTHRPIHRPREERWPPQLGRGQPRPRALSQPSRRLRPAGGPHTCARLVCPRLLHIPPCGATRARGGGSHAQAEPPANRPFSTRPQLMGQWTGRGLLCSRPLRPWPLRGSPLVRGSCSAGTVPPTSSGTGLSLAPKPCPQLWCPQHPLPLAWPPGPGTPAWGWLVRAQGQNFGNSPRSSFRPRTTPRRRAGKASNEAQMQMRHPKAIAPDPDSTAVRSPHVATLRGLAHVAADSQLGDLGVTSLLGPVALGSWQIGSEVSPSVAAIGGGSRDAPEKGDLPLCRPHAVSSNCALRRRQS